MLKIIEAENGFLIEVTRWNRYIEADVLQSLYILYREEDDLRRLLNERHKTGQRANQRALDQVEGP